MVEIVEQFPDEHHSAVCDVVLKMVREYILMKKEECGETVYVLNPNKIEVFIKNDLI
jgi:hypothetical protein